MNDLRTVLQLRRAVSQSAVAKYRAILDRQHEGRVGDTLIFCGASRTGRWGGRGLQPQNLKRPPPDIDPVLIAEQIATGAYPDYGTRGMEVLGGAIRAAICASEGHVLVVCDLASIESRVLGWLTGDPELLGIFQQGRDPYRAFASRWLHKPYDDVTKAERNLSKPPSLGCGYGLGAAGLVKYAASMGVTLTERDARDAVRVFRRTYAEVPVFWKWINEAFARAVQGQGTSDYRLTLAREDTMLTLRLPSGRKLYYKDPQRTLEGDLAYRGQNSYTHKWELIRTYGARLTENIVQAIARDLLAYGLRLAHEAKLKIVGHVHDEIICEIPEREALDALKRLRDCMTSVPDWALGLLLGAEGHIGKRYWKN